MQDRKNGTKKTQSSSFNVKQISMMEYKNEEWQQCSEIGKQLASDSHSNLC